MILKRSLIAKKKFRSDKKKYIAQYEKCRGGGVFTYNKNHTMPILFDYIASAGYLDEHYFLQDIFVASYVTRMGIKHIYDIGSRVDGYIGHLLSGDIHVTMIDIRPLSVEIDGLDFIQDDATMLSSIVDGSIAALSSLHALEHFGLGRYGDTVDYNGWKKALDAFVRKIATGGVLILSVPVGCSDVLVFNAHRIFMPITIYNQVCNLMSLESFTLIQNFKMQTFTFNSEDDVQEKLTNIAKTLDYDCGIFILRKH